MSRAAILPHPADPFLLNYWLRFYREIWGDEINTLYVHVNSPIEKEVFRLMAAMANPFMEKIEMFFSDTQLEHGTAIDIVLDNVKEEYVMLIEDDGFIFRKGAVDMAFTALENGTYDIVGSARGSCSIEIYELAGQLFGLDYSGVGDRGPNFWPCYFFSKTAILRETDRNFCARAWKRDEVIEPLRYKVAQEILVGDTFVNTSLQLRAKGYKINLIPQYHGSPEDIQHSEERSNLFDGVAPWIHVGSLSSGVHGVLQDNRGRALARRLIDEPKQERTVLPQYCNTAGERNEWERRVAFWELFYDYGTNVTEALPEFSALYREAIDRVIEQFGLSRSEIARRKRLYNKLGL